jgi:phosphatidylglycerophosphatase A
MVAAALALATCFGVGYAPIAPGTFGSLAGLALWFVLPASIAVQTGAVAVVFVGGVWAAGVAERHFHATDPGPVVIDEVLGMLVTLFLVPVGWPGALVGFFFFRLFDVVKPYPANRFERLPGGIGIMADDFMAAVYANIVLRILLEIRDVAIGS